MTASSTTVGKRAPLENPRFQHEEGVSWRAVETRDGFFETAGRYVVKTVAITTAVALPVLAIANEMGAFSSGQNLDTREPTHLSRNYTLTSTALNIPSACTQNLAVGFFGTLLTQSLWPALAGFFGCVPGASAQVSSGSGSSASNPVLSCNNANPQTYIVGQWLPPLLVIDGSVSVSDPSTGGLLEGGSATLVNPGETNSLDFNQVPGLSISKEIVVVNPSLSMLTISAAPTSGSVTTAQSLQQFLRSITFSSTASTPGSAEIIFDVLDESLNKASCIYHVNMMDTPTTTGSGSGSDQTLAPTTTGSGSGSGQTLAPTTTGSGSGSGQTLAPTTTGSGSGSGQTLAPTSVRVPTPVPPPFTPTSGSGANTNSAAPAGNNAAIIGGAAGGGMVFIGSLSGLLYYLKNRRKPTGHSPEVDSTRASMHFVVAPETEYKPFDETQTQQQSPRETEQT